MIRMKILTLIVLSLAGCQSQQYDAAGAPRGELSPFLQIGQPIPPLNDLAPIGSWANPVHVAGPYTP